MNNSSSKIRVLHGDLHKFREEFNHLNKMMIEKFYTLKYETVEKHTINNRRTLIESSLSLIKEAIKKPDIQEDKKMPNYFTLIVKTERKGEKVTKMDIGFITSEEKIGNEKKLIVLLNTDLKLKKEKSKLEKYDTITSMYTDTMFDINNI